MKTRIITACALLPLLLAVVLFAPKIFTAILFGVMGAVAAYELNKTTGNTESRLLLVSSCVAAFAISIISYFGFNGTWMLLCILAFVVLIFASIMIKNAASTIK